MPATPEQARDAILDLFKTAWDTGSAPLNGGVAVPVVWTNIDPGAHQPKDSPWARITVRHSGGGQSTLAEPLDQRNELSGTVFVQIFTPVGIRGQTLADRLGKIALETFEGATAGAVWFRRVQLREVGPDGPWYQINVSADFAYDQVKSV
jgi:hypothetical protein